MGTNECSQPASKSFCDSQDFGDISMVLKMAHFRKSTGPRWVNITVRHWWVNIGSDNGLVPSGNKPLPGPMLTQLYTMSPYLLGHNDLKSDWRLLITNLTTSRSDDDTCYKLLK